MAEQKESRQANLSLSNLSKAASSRTSMDYDPLCDKDEGGNCSTFLRYIVLSISMLFSLIPLTWLFCIKIFDQYERAVVFRLGKLQNETPFGPGICYMMPFVDTFRRVDMRIKSIPISGQDVMTHDSVTINVQAVVFFHVKNATKAVLVIQNYVSATRYLAATTLRAVVGKSELDELLTKRESINNKLKNILLETASDWGIAIDAVEIKDVKLPPNMQRVMASQAEAERDRRAKVISANGELQAAENLYDAADKMSQNPATIQLRYLQTLTAISAEHPTTIVFPLPMKMGSLAGFMKPLRNFLGLNQS